MSTTVALLFFIVINFLGMAYVFGRKTYTLPSVYTNNEKWTFTHEEMFVLLTLACAPLACAPFGALAVRLLGWLLLCGIGLLVQTKPFIFSGVSFFYVLYLIWLLISLSETPYPDYGFRLLMKYLLPFLLLLYVPRAVMSASIFEKGLKYTYVIFLLVNIYMLFSGRLHLEFLFGNTVWWGPAVMDAYSVALPVMVVSAACFRNKHYYFLLIFLLLVPTVGYVVRTGLVVLVISGMAMALFRYRIKALPVILIIFGIAVASVIYVPQIRSKMFVNTLSSEYILRNYQKMDMEDIQSNGRYSMWENLTKKFYDRKPLTGSGIGSTQAFMYSDGLLGLHVPHNDYIQILCDTGNIGLILYALVLIIMAWHSYLLFNDKKLSRQCRYAAFIAGTSICGMAASMMTDNVVNYTMTTLVYPFTFYGMALGLKNLNEDSDDTKIQCDNSAL